MQNNNTVSQHRVPQFILKNFLSSDLGKQKTFFLPKKSLVTDSNSRAKITGKNFAKPIKNIFYSDLIFDFITTNGNEISLEEKFAQVESEAARVIKRLINFDNPSEFKIKDKLAIANFFHSILTRQNIIDIRINPEPLSLNALYLDLDLNGNIWKIDLSIFPQYQQLVQPYSGSYFQTLCMAFCELIIFEYDWYLICTENQPFVIGDKPVLNRLAIHATTSKIL